MPVVWGGRRIHEATPGSHWKIMTILGAMSTRGMIATMTIEEATDTEIFLAYLEHVLCPQLRSGDVVVMDNLSSHKVDGVHASGSWSGTALPAALFARPEPDRKGLVKAQTTPPISQSKDQRGPRTGHHRPATSDPPDNAQAWFQVRRLWSISMKCSNGWSSLVWSLGQGCASPD